MLAPLHSNLSALFPNIPTHVEWIDRWIDRLTRSSLCQHMRKHAINDASLAQYFGRQGLSKDLGRDLPQSSSSRTFKRTWRWAALTSLLGVHGDPLHLLSTLSISGDRIFASTTGRGEEKKENQKHRCIKPGKGPHGRWLRYCTMFQSSHVKKY